MNLLEISVFCAFAFLLPEKDDFKTWCEIIRNNFEDNTDKLLDYFEVLTLTQSDIMPLGGIHYFPLVCEICFNRMEQELPRTNNSIEDWHSSFQGLPSCHLEFWKFWGVLKKEETFARASILQHQGSHLWPAMQTVMLEFWEF